MSSNERQNPVKFQERTRKVSLNASNESKWRAETWCRDNIFCFWWARNLQKIKKLKFCKPHDYILTSHWQKYEKCKFKFVEFVHVKCTVFTVHYFIDLSNQAIRSITKYSAAQMSPGRYSSEGGGWGIFALLGHLALHRQLNMTTKYSRSLLDEIAPAR